MEDITYLPSGMIHQVECTTNKKQLGHQKNELCDNMPGMPEEDGTTVKIGSILFRGAL